MMDLNHLIKIAEDAGWRERPCKVGVILYPPDESLPPITIHNQHRKTHTSAGHYKAVKAKMRQAGLDV